MKTNLSFNLKPNTDPNGILGKNSLVKDKLHTTKLPRQLLRLTTKSTSLKPIIKQSIILFMIVDGAGP